MYTRPVNYDRNAGKTTYLYFIESGQYTKIGLASDPEARLKIFQLGNPHKIRIAHRRTIPACLAVQVERSIHRQLAHCALGREWFQITAKEAVKLSKPFIDKAHRTANNWMFEDRSVHQTCSADFQDT